MTTLILDNEAVQALLDPHHVKHRRVLAHLTGLAQRRARKGTGTAVVPTAVRVEAGWDRREPRAASPRDVRVIVL
jgi:hypothetical protein